MKNVILTMLVFCIIGVAQANLLSNGDFNLPGDGTTATDWTAWSWSNNDWWNAWANTEQATWGSPGGTYHITVGSNGNGGGGVNQIVPATAGQPYTLTVDSGAEAWWLPTGRMLMFFLDDANDVLLEVSRKTVDPDVYGNVNPDDYDIVHPWESYSLTATAPAGATQVKVEFTSQENGRGGGEDPSVATGSVGFDNASLVLDYSRPYDPDPFDGEDSVAVGKVLSWSVRLTPTLADPNVFELDPNLVSHKLYMANVGADDPNDPNVVFVADIPENWSGDPLRESYSPTLLYDSRYKWRVDSVMDDASVITGHVWEFYSEASIPVITGQPVYQLLDAAGDPASFSVTATSVTTESYQWYKDGAALSDGATGSGATISGANTATLSISDVQIADEGSYHCEIDNQATNPAGPIYPVASDTAALGIKREIAHWSFTGGSTSATNDESQTITTTTVGDPVTAVGILGDGMAFDADTGAEDMIYTDPNQTFFDICNYNMTVGCWINTAGTGVPEWSPLVARNGEEDGWQLRRGNVGAAGDERPIFTTRGTTGNADGSAALDTAFDGGWHYVVGTYDGASKKLYVDGILQIVNWLVDGAVNSSEGDDATGLITPSASGVSIAGRFGWYPPQVDDQFVAGTYDEVEIWNYARTAAEIGQTYATLSNNPVCTSPPASDLTNDCKVNLDDFAKLAFEWLTDNNVQP